MSQPWNSSQRPDQPPPLPRQTGPQPGAGYPPQGAGYAPQGTREPPPVNKDDNAIRALFDFTFRRYATPGAVKVIFGIFFVVAVLAMILFVGRGVLGLVDGHDGLLGLVFIVGGILVPFLVLLLVRVLLEFAVATVRMSRNTASCATTWKRSSSAAQQLILLHRRYMAATHQRNRLASL